MNPFPRTLTALMLALVLCLSAVAAFASETEATPVPDQAEPMLKGVSFLPFTGEVQEVRPFYEQDGTENPSIQYVLLKNDEGGEMNFVVDKTTVLVGDPSLEVGQKLTGFYDGNAPAIMIYPPQMTAVLLTPWVEGGQTALALFDAEMVSLDGQLKIATDEETLIENEAGEPYEGELTGQLLFVLYGPSTRSIPAQTTAIRVVVLESRVPEGQTGSLSIVREPMDEGEAEGKPSAFHYMVEGKAVEAPAAFTTEDGVLMVPVRPLVEALGLPLVQDENNKDLYAVGRVVTLTVGRDAYTFARMAPIELGTAPVERDGEIFVPLDFFTQVVKMKNASVEDDQIVINNQSSDAE